VQHGNVNHADGGERQSCLLLLGQVLSKKQLQTERFVGALPQGETVAKEIPKPSEGRRVGSGTTQGKEFCSENIESCKW
jgi:hypothetical protein